MFQNHRQSKNRNQKVQILRLMIKGQMNGQVKEIRNLSQLLLKRLRMMLRKKSKQQNKPKQMKN